MATRDILMPPEVEPAQAPVNISITSAMRQKVGHREKSTVAKPVVVMMVTVWKAGVGDGIPEGHPRLHPQIDAQQQRGRRHDTDVDPQLLAAEHLLQLAANGQKHQGEIHAGQEGEHGDDPHDRLGRAGLGRYHKSRSRRWPWW